MVRDEERYAYLSVGVHSLKNLTEKGLVEVLGFVIMPNHIHLI